MKTEHRIIYIRDNKNSGWKWEKKPFKSLMNLFLKRKFGLYSHTRSKWIVNPEYDHIIFKSMNGFNYFVLQMGVSLLEEAKYIFYNLDNGFVFTKPGTDWFNFNENGLSKFEYNGKYGIIHVSGKVIFDAKFDVIGNDLLWDGNTNCIRVSLNNKFGFTNLKGEWLIEPCLENVGYYFDDKHNTIAAKQNGYWGIIDSKGNWVLPAIYDDLRAPGLSMSGCFDNNNHAIVTRNNKDGIVDRSGQILFEPLYEKLYGFGDYYYNENKKHKIKKEPLYKKDDGNIFDTKGTLEAYHNGSKVILSNPQNK